jgi:hypothetical protein
MEDRIEPKPAGPDREGPRAPYEKPAIAWEEDMDVRPTLIAACGKVDLAEADCLATGPGS